MLLRRYHNKTKEPEENKLSEQPTKGDVKNVDTIGIDKLTKADIGEILSQRGIEFNPRDKKEDLYDLMIGSD